jgi:hypothetical protein
MAKRSIVRCMSLLLPELMIVYGIIPYAQPLGMSVHVYPGFAYYWLCLWEFDGGFGKLAIRELDCTVLCGHTCVFAY